MFFTFEFLCLSYFVLLFFVFILLIVFLGGFFKVVHSFLIFSFSVVGAIDIHVGNETYGQEPINRSEQLPCARAMAFSRTSLFLERFLARILNVF